MRLRDTLSNDFILPVCYRVANNVWDTLGVLLRTTTVKMSSKKDGKGTCELNKHNISLINENNNFHDQQGVAFFMMLKVTCMSLPQMTWFRQTTDYIIPV